MQAISTTLLDINSQCSADASKLKEAWAREKRQYRYVVADAEALAALKLAANRRQEGGTEAEGRRPHGDIGSSNLACSNQTKHAI